MPKLAKELGALAVSRLAEPGLYFVGGVPGLALHITVTGAKSWILRAVIAGKRREMGLGSFPGVTLAMAKDRAREARDLIRQGVDPVERQRAAKSALAAAAAAALTFDACAAKYIAANEAGWRNAKHRAQWETTLATYASPAMGKLLVRDVGLSHVLAALEPIWREKTETALRVRGRIEAVLDWATARGYREGLNPARWRGHLDKLLPKPTKVTTVEHHPAVAVDEIGAFMVKLRASAGVGARALEFAILTAARSGEVRGATWGEIDLKAGLWVVPAVRMKAAREHRVPLSSAALALLAQLHQGQPDELVFIAPRGAMLSDMTLTAVMRRMGLKEVPHGFRSTFRDWAAERTNHPHEAAELALAHAIGDKVEAAYRRGDMFERRRQLMEDWAGFTSLVQPTGAKVVPLQGRPAKTAAGA